MLIIKRCCVFMFMFLLGYTLFADGMSVRKWLKLKDVVTRARYIFVAKVVRVDHKYGKRRAYGEVRCYVSKYRLKVTAEKIYRGNKRFVRALKKNSNQIWIERYGNYIPGKWVLVSEHYRESFNFFRAKPGDTLIVYARSLFDRKIYFQYGDKLYKQQAVLSLIRK